MDDLIDTAGTLVNGAEALIERGALSGDARAPLTPCCRGRLLIASRSPGLRKWSLRIRFRFRKRPGRSGASSSFRSLHCWPGPSSQSTRRPPSAYCSSRGGTRPPRLWFNSKLRALQPTERPPGGFSHRTCIPHEENALRTSITVAAERAHVARKERGPPHPLRRQDSRGGLRRLQRARSRRRSTPARSSPSSAAATGYNTIFDLDIEGREKTPVMVVDQQFDPLKGNLLHVDFKRIDLTKRIRVAMPVVPEGEPKGVKVDRVGCSNW